jgi:hypothetical protein
MNYAIRSFLYAAALSTALLPAISASAAELNTATIVNVGLSGYSGSASTSLEAHAQTNASAAPAEASHKSTLSALVHIFSNTGTSASKTASSSPENPVLAFVRSDAQVSDAAMSDKEVSLTYLTHAKLFGFIRVTVPVKASVNAGGRVALHYPWYGMFLTGDNATLKANLTSAANSSLSSSTQAELTAEQQMLLLQEVHAVLQAQFEATSSVKA